MKYRKKPVVIEAFRFQMDSEMPDWFNEKRITNEIVTYDDGTCNIKTLEGVMHADKGDYIIPGIKGEVYPCKPDIFEQTYESSDELISVNVLVDGEKVMDSIKSGVKQGLRTAKFFNA
jgi:hypothetical protein